MKYLMKYSVKHDERFNEVFNIIFKLFSSTSMKEPQSTCAYLKDLNWRNPQCVNFSKAFTADADVIRLESKL